MLKGFFFGTQINITKELLLQLVGKYLMENLVKKRKKTPIDRLGSVDLDTLPNELINLGSNTINLATSLDWVERDENELLSRLTTIMEDIKEETIGELVDNYVTEEGNMKFIEKLNLDADHHYDVDGKNAEVRDLTLSNILTGNSGWDNYPFKMGKIDLDKDQEKLLSGRRMLSEDEFESSVDWSKMRLKSDFSKMNQAEVFLEMEVKEELLTPIWEQEFPKAKVGWKDSNEPKKDTVVPTPNYEKTLSEIKTTNKDGWEGGKSMGSEEYGQNVQSYIDYENEPVKGAPPEGLAESDAVLRENYVRGVVKERLYDILKQNFKEALTINYQSIITFNMNVPLKNKGDSVISSLKVGVEHQKEIDTAALGSIAGSKSGTLANVINPKQSTFAWSKIDSKESRDKGYNATRKGYVHLLGRHWRELEEVKRSLGE
jgi:hypothetical protein